EMSATCQDLTKRAAEQAQLVRAAADDAAKILQIATILAAGADDSVRRNSAVAGVAKRHKDVLDQSTAQLAKLVEEVERGAAAAEAEANDVWSREIANMAGEMRRLVEEIGARLNSVAEGTENLLASAQQIAASSEEQSASTEEIASSANQLAEAADKLTGAV